MISMLRKEACSGSIHDLAHIPTQNCLADCLTKASANSDNLITVVKTGRLLDVEIHPNFRKLMEQKGFFSTWCGTFMDTMENDVFLPECFDDFSRTNSTKRTIPCDVCETDHNQEQKKQKVCDWIHLSLSVAVLAKPTSRRDRDSELTQNHFSTQTKTFEHEAECYENNV